MTDLYHRNRFGDRLSALEREHAPGLPRIGFAVEVDCLERREAERDPFLTRD